MQLEESRRTLEVNHALKLRADGSRANLALSRIRSHYRGAARASSLVPERIDRKEGRGYISHECGGSGGLEKGFRDTRSALNTIEKSHAMRINAKEDFFKRRDDHAPGFDFLSLSLSASGVQIRREIER